MQRVNITYMGQTIHSDVPMEKAAEILQDLAEQYYEGADFDPSELELEPVD